MLRRLALRDFVIVPALELEFYAGFSALTGETGAGKSILIDALQLALGGRGDAGLVREGAVRAEVSAEFDTPAALGGWLEEAGFGAGSEAGLDVGPDGATLLLRRTLDAQGKSRAWINGSPATLLQLREVADHLLDIHGQHAWQSLTRASATRAMVDAQAGLDTADLAKRFADRKAAAERLAQARDRADEIGLERERLAWQIGELDKLGPAEGEWAELSAEHQRLANAQALMDAVRRALDAVTDAERSNAETLTSRAVDMLSEVSDHDRRIVPAIESLQGALAQLQDAARTLNNYLGHVDLEPDRLAEIDARLSAWMGMARRYRRPADQLAALLLQWRTELAALEAASDTAALEADLAQADRHYLVEAQRVSAGRARAAGPLAAAVTDAMQGLGLAGGCFEVLLSPLASPQSQGLETVEFLVAGHAGSTPRPLAKVASGGELSRLALAIAVTTLGAVSSASAAGLQAVGRAHTLIFDEVDAGIGGAVGDTVGALMKQLGSQRQVLAVTHLAQVAACADHHYLVSKATRADGQTVSNVVPVTDEARVVEVARMLGGQRLADTRLAHARAMLQPTVTPDASAALRASHKTRKSGKT